MGQKAKNAGKKQSKTCDKLATAPSLRFNGKAKIVYCDNMESYLRQESIINSRSLADKTVLHLEIN